MKPTMSKDGKMRVTVQVRYRMALGDLVDAFCYSFTKDHYDLALADNVEMAIEAKLKIYNSKASIMKMIDGAIHDCGDTWWTWTDNGSERWCNALREQVRVMITKKIKGLK